MSIFYVIGNGFDKHYGLSSDYCNFKKYLKNKDEEIVNKVDDLFYRKLEDTEYKKDTEYGKDAERHLLWSNFESMLKVFSDLDYFEIFEEVMSNAQDDVDRSDYWDNPSFNVEYYNEYIDLLKSSFKDWIQKIDKEIINDHIFQFNDSDFFLTFNYTLALEKYFKIKAENIFHIHGDINSEIILGHNNKTEPCLVKLSSYEDDYRIASTSMKINELLKRAALLYFKDSKNIIKKNNGIFNSISNYEDVVIAGWSCGDEDKEYMQEIVQKASHITFYHYEKVPQDLYKFETLMKDFNYSKYCIKKW